MKRFITIITAVVTVLCLSVSAHAADFFSIAEMHVGGNLTVLLSELRKGNVSYEVIGYNQVYINFGKCSDVGLKSIGEVMLAANSKNIIWSDTRMLMTLPLFKEDGVTSNRQQAIEEYCKILERNSEFYKYHSDGNPREEIIYLTEHQHTFRYNYQFWDKPYASRTYTVFIGRDYKEFGIGEINQDTALKD